MKKKNPTLGYFLHVQKSGGPVMTWNGDRFTNNEPFHAFTRADTAKREAKKLLKQFPILDKYRVWVASKFHTAPTTDGKKLRSLRGGSKAPKVNPAKYHVCKHGKNPLKCLACKRERKKNPGQRNQAELDDAARLLEDFTGHRVSHLESGYSRSKQKTGLIVGEVDVIGYRAKRDGKTERYGHHFKKNSRPLLAVTTDGKQLHIVGGQYEFTEAGIEDR